MDSAAVVQTEQLCIVVSNGFSVRSVMIQQRKIAKDGDE